MPLYAAVVMKGGAVFIEQIFQIDFNISLLIFTLVIAAYVIAGGMKGVMYTDALQAVIMFACMLFLLFSLYQVLDMNFTEANKELTAIAPLVPESLRHWDIRGGLRCLSRVLHNGIRWLLLLFWVLESDVWRNRS